MCSKRTLKLLYGVKLPKLLVESYLLLATGNDMCTLELVNVDFSFVNHIIVADCLGNASY
jgi:hypothetical protein